MYFTQQYVAKRNSCLSIAIIADGKANFKYCRNPFGNVVQSGKKHWFSRMAASASRAGASRAGAVTSAGRLNAAGAA